MTTFADLQTLVYDETRRPDLVNETINAIKKATLKYHLADKWLLDMVQVVVPLTPLYTGDARYQVPTNASPFVRFRDIGAIREYQNPPTPYFLTLEATAFNDILEHGYAIEKNNYYYRAGQVINMRMERQLSNVLVSYYQLPDVTQATYSSWIADNFPHMIVEEVCTKEFKMTGKDSTAKAYQDMFNENLSELRQFSIVSGG